MAANNRSMHVEDELRIIFDSVPAWIFYKDKENRFIRVNKAFLEGMKMPREKLEGASVFDVYPKEQADAFWKDDLEVIGSGKPKYNIVEPIVSGKELRWVETHKIPYRDANNDIIGVIGFSIDVTERKRIEDELKRARTYFEGILNAVPDPIFVKDREHRWTLLNDACCRFMGDKRENRIGRSDHEFFPVEEADMFWKKDEEVFLRKSTNLNEESFTDSHGKTHIIRTKKSYHMDEVGNEFIVGVIRDVTDSKAAEEELKKRLHELEVFQKATMDREKKVVELKNRIAELEEKLEKKGVAL